MIRIMSRKNEQVARVHANSFVLDAHSDMTMFDVYPRRVEGEKGVMKRIHLPRHKKGGVHGAVVTVGADVYRWATHYEGATKQTLEIIDGLYSEVEESDGKMVIARTGSEMENARAHDMFSVLMSLEGAKALEGNLGVLRSLYRLGLRAIGLIYNRGNQFGHGAGEKQNYGLTALGRQVIEEVNRLPMILDLAHISERGFYDALEVVKRPPVITHTGCKALYVMREKENPWRSVTDKQIQAIADRGGVVGVPTVSHFLSDQPTTIKDYIRHLEHIIKLTSIDHVGTGFDFEDYVTSLHYAWLGAIGPPLPKTPENDPTVKGLENITKIPNLTAALLNKGYSEGEVGKIMGGNFLRVFRKVLG
jgi:membrane dipeptidase